MTPANKIQRDVRMDARGLYHRTGVTLPATVNPDGTASPDQLAKVAAGTNLALALLPHRELRAVPAHSRGAAIVGTREPDLSSYLPAGHFSILACYPNPSIPQPQSQHDILKWLLEVTGLTYAPSAVWILAGWKAEWVASFLWRLLSGGAEGALIVAERQAACALRQFWLTFSGNLNERGSGAKIAGGDRLGRALVDTVSALFSLINEGDAAGQMNDEERKAARFLQRKLLGMTTRYVRFFELAKTRKLGPAKMRGAFKAAKEVLDVIAMFTVSDRELGVRVKRAEKTATKRTSDVIDGSSALNDILDSLEERLDCLAVDGQPPKWPEKYCISLDRLDNACRTDRMSAIKAVSTQHIYKLIVTRRLDQLYAVLPWLAALSGAFPGVWGGPLGAVAQLFETARTYEIALELGSRLYDPGDPDRLDVKKGKQAYANSHSVAQEVGDETRAGFRIAEHALSHSIINAWMAGLQFNRHHPIAAITRGSLRWSTKEAIRDLQTANVTTGVEHTKLIYQTQGYDRDLPAYAGLTLVAFIGHAIVNIFRANLRGPAFGKHVANVDLFDRDTLKRLPPEKMADSSPTATRELVRSMLKSMDVEIPDDIDLWPAKALVTCPPAARELARADGLLKAHDPARGKDTETGGAIRRNATKHEKAIGNPTRRIRRLMDQARTWTEPKKGKGGSVDAPLERVLAGKKRSYSLTPVAHQPIYVLWFMPDIDRHLIEWIAKGASATSIVWFSNPNHAAAIAGPINALRARAAPLYAVANIDQRCTDVAVILFTCFSSLMSDDAHPRS